MRKRIAIVVTIVVGASCIPWLRHQHFSPALVVATTIILFALIAYGVVRTLLSWSIRAASKSESTRPVGLYQKSRRLLILVPLFLVLVLIVPHFIAISSGEYKLAVATAHKSAQFTEALGSPVKEGWFSEGKSELGDRAKSEIVIPVYGRTCKGNLHAVALKEDGSWKLQKLSLELTDPEDRIDLLAGGGGLTR